MKVSTRLSAKGQIVLPVAVRNRLQWAPGDELEVIEHAGGVTLRSVPKPKPGRSADEVIAEIRRLVNYTGTRISDEDMDAAVRRMAGRNDTDR